MQCWSRYRGQATMRHLYMRERCCCWLTAPCERRVITFLLNINVLHTITRHSHIIHCVIVLQQTERAANWKHNSHAICYILTSEWLVSLQYNAISCNCSSAAVASNTHDPSIIRYQKYSVSQKKTRHPTCVDNFTKY